MAVLICGRKIRVHKPIRLNDLFRFMVLGGFVFLSFLQHSYAGEKNNEQVELSPAYALALALGVRSISGPVERTIKVPNKITSNTHHWRAPHSPQDMGNTIVASMTSRLPRPPMEE